MTEPVNISPEEFNKIISLESDVLELVASHKKTSYILDKLCLLAQSMLENSVASIMVKDKATGKMSVVSAPHLPREGHIELSNIAPGPRNGSCANAVYKSKPQYVTDAQEDSRFSNLKDLVKSFNIHSCWSMPIKDKNKNAIGSFALSSPKPQEPHEFHKKLLETVSRIASIVLRNQANEQRLRLFSTAMKHANEGVIVTNKDNKIIEINSRFFEIYGYTENELLGKNPSYLSSGKNPKKLYHDMWESLNTHSHWNGEVTNRSKNGNIVNQWISISKLYDENGKLENYFGVFSDITELKQSQAQIEYLAYHDTLTKLYNKTYLEKRLDQSDKKSTLLLLNIDNFSYLNTTYGFEFGDKLLVEISNILLDNFGTEYVFRINSDEFAIVYDCNINIKEKIKDIQSYFYSNRIDVNDINLKLSFTYGAATSGDDLLRDATLAIKRAKNIGKNTYHIYDQNSDQITYEDREKFVNSNNLLHYALDEDRIIPYFQGIINNHTAKIDKFEALVRIKKQDGTIASAYEFLEAAKLSGLLPEITKIMIDKTFKCMKDNDFTFSINITEDDLTKDYLYRYLEKKSKQYEIDPSRVTLEILEGVSSNSKSNSVTQLIELRKAGYVIAIDDFGAEYSNFERILDLDVGLLKIDAKYIKDIDFNKKSYEVVKAISFFAKNANIPTVAEFVHSKDVQKIVKKLGIDFSQGFYFSEPAPTPQVSLN